jgi:DNA helicase HerA-like ATPase
MLQYVGDNAAQFTTQYGNISPASIGAVQRNLLALESQGADKYFAEPALNLDDFIQTDATGRGIVNILAADKLMQSPRVYATLLLWLLSELFERQPEVGDSPKPKLVFSSTKRTCCSERFSPRCWRKSSRSSGSFARRASAFSS